MNIHINLLNRWIGIAGVLWLISGVGFFGMRFFAPLMVLGLPFSIPGLILLGTDEVQERYGYWGEPFYFWLLALPCSILYALMIRRFYRAVRG
ncbi:MAG: hypothetical protein EOP87_08430 [Verrucomicrobiaceae bacterium]|nr:MAG: hypothetical protein EOP87_08430 [Verrucomicrobiaceae bacterium]